MRRLLLTAAVLALVVGSMPTPAAAVADTRVFDIQGIPGRKIDVCASGGGGEVISSFRYGKTKSSFVPPGTYRLRVFVADPRPCRGTKLAQADVTFAPGGNMTIVYGMFDGKPGIRAFDNAIALSSADVASVVFRHTAKAPKLDVFLMQTVKTATALGPTWAGVGNGKQGGPIEVPERTSEILAFRAGTYALRGFLALDVQAGRAYQAYLVGTKASNYRIVRISQPGVVF